jgi:hypothetical protein
MFSGEITKSIRWVVVVLLAAGGSIWSSAAAGEITAAGDIGAYDAIVLESDIVSTISSGGKFEDRIHTRIKVLNAQGRQYGHIVVYESQFVKLKDFLGTVTDASGKETMRSRESDGQKYCGFGGYELYSDKCLREFWLFANSYPYTIDYQYVISGNSLMYWGSWQPQTAIPVQHARYTLIRPADFIPVVKAVGTIPPPVRTEKGGNTVEVWELRDIAPIKDEGCATPYADDLMALRFAPLRFEFGEYTFDGTGWESLGRDYYAMVRDRLLLSDEQSVLADSVGRSAGGPRAALHELYQVLSRRMRYVAVEIGVGGWQPHPSAQTFAAGYGDCKDLATVSVSMLRRAGLAAFPALALTRNAGQTDPSFPDLHFNHAIYFTLFDGDTVWADATCPFCPPGDLPWQDENICVLAVDSAAGTIVRTPPSTPEDNQTVRKAIITINNDKSISATIDFAVTGNSRHWLISGVAALEKRDQSRLFRDDVFGISAAMSIDSFTVPAAGDYSTPLTARVYGRMRNGVLNVGRKWYVNIEFLSPFGSCETADHSSRTRGLDLSYPRMFCDSIIINIPEFWTAGSLPEDTAIDDALGSASRNCRVVDNRLIIVQDRKSFRYTIPPDGLAEFQKHISALKAVLAGQIALYEKDE